MRPAGALLRALLLLWLALPALGADPAADKARELKALRQQIDRLRNEIESAEGNKADVLDELRASERAISEINRRLRELNEELATVNQELAASRRESTALKARIEAQQSELARLLLSQYEAGAPDGLRLLLNQQDPNQIARDLTYATYLARARAELIARLRADLAAAEVLERETRARSETLARLTRERETERQALEKEALKRRATLARLEKEIAARRQQVERLTQDEKRLTRLIERLTRAMAEKARAKSRPPKAEGGTAMDSGEFARLKGSLALPVKGEITNRFGAPRAETGIPWKGVFIRAPEGSPVKALAAGRVVFADWLRGFGNLLIIDHGDGYMSLYGHNHSIYKQVGEKVVAGEVVSATGDSGGQGESGLYFEVRFQGKPVDPLQWVGRR